MKLPLHVNLLAPSEFSTFFWELFVKTTFPPCTPQLRFSYGLLEYHNIASMMFRSLNYNLEKRFVN